MTSSAHEAIAAQASLRLRLLALLHDGDFDAALQAGLMAYVTTGDEEDAPIREAQAKLRNAWAARERYRARETRLARRAAERAARRSATAQPPTGGGSLVEHVPVADVPAGSAPENETPARPALPAAAAAALARARARAAGKASG